VIFKVDNASGIFYWENISKTSLEKVFFFILNGFFLIWGFMSKNVKNGPSES
jgi:hypothetical protein